MKNTDTGSRQRGFTLIELVMVILLLGVLGAMGSEFISLAFKGFRDSDTRIEMYEEGKLALMRMERELQIALPNAVDVSDGGGAISFGVIDEVAMAGAGVFGRYTEEHPAGGNTINDIISDDEGVEQALPVGTLVSIYNTNWDEFGLGARIYEVSSTAGATMTLSPGIASSSPYRRYFAVRDRAVRFAVIDGNLMRQTAEVNTGGVQEFSTGYPLVQNVVQNDEGDQFFSYAPGTSQRSAVVNIHFAIARNGEVVNFHKEIQIRNVP